MLRLFMNKTIFWSADESEISPAHGIFSLKTTEEVNTIGTMTFTIASSHPRYKEMKIRRSIFLLADDNNVLFVGRLVDYKENFNFMVEITVNDMMDVLSSITSSYYIYSGGYWQNLYGTSVVPTKNRAPIEAFINNEVIGHAFSSNLFGNLIDWPNFPQIQNGYIEEPKDVSGNPITDSEDFFYELGNNLFETITNVYLKNSNSLVLISYGNGSVSTESNQVTYSGFSMYFNVVSNIMDVKIPYNTFTNYGNCRDFFELGDNIIEFTTETIDDEKVSGIIPFFNDNRENSTHEAYIDGENTTEYGDAIYLGGYFSQKVIQNQGLFDKYGLNYISVDFGDALDGASDSDEEDRLREKAETYMFLRYRNYTTSKYTVKAIDHYYIPDQEVPEKPVLPETEDGDYIIGYDEYGDPIIVSPTVDPEVEEYEEFDINTFYVEGRYLGNMPIMIADPVLLYSKPHGVYVTLPCLAKEVDYFNHSNDSYVLSPYCPEDYLDPKMVNVSGS